MNLSRIYQVQVHCGGKYCHVFNTLKAYIYIHLIHSLQSLLLHDIIHLNNIHTFGINLDQGIPLDHWAYQWYLCISMVLTTSQLLSSNFSTSKYTISHMKHDQSHTLPFIPVKPTHPTTLICFYLIHLTKIDEINYLQFISIIGIIGNQWKTQTQLWEQWSTTSLPMDPLYIRSDYGGVLSLFCLFVKFGIGYPELAVPVPLVIVYLICLKFT